MTRFRRFYLGGLYLLATVQFIWCYLWMVRPYVNTLAYERGLERMPFQGRLLMIPPMQWAHQQVWIDQISATMHTNIYWFPRPMQPEAIVQAFIDFACVAVAGIVATKIYQAASRYQFMTALVYPVVIVLCVGTYVLHTIQNFRFIYDLPSLAFFSIALWLIYFRKPAWIFIVVFLVATLNRETTLMLLPIYALSRTIHSRRIEDEAGKQGPSNWEGRPQWHELWAPKTLAVVLPLAVYWLAWQFEVRQIYAHNVSEFYPRISQNIDFLFSPRAWPQMLGACCYLFPVILISRKHLRDSQLQVWLWVLPVWFSFMFVYGILIETRIFGELIPYIACAAALITEESIAVQMRGRVHSEDRSSLLPSWVGAESEEPSVAA